MDWHACPRRAGPGGWTTLAATRPGCLPRHHWPVRVLTRAIEYILVWTDEKLCCAVQGCKQAMSHMNPLIYVARHRTNWIGCSWSPNRTLLPFGLLARALVVWPVSECILGCCSGQCSLGLWWIHLPLTNAFKEQINYNTNRTYIQIEPQIVVV